MPNFIVSLSALLAPIMMLLLIGVDYMKSYVVDRFQRRICLYIIAATLIAISGDFLYDAFAGMPGRFIHALLYFSCFCYYVFQVAAFCMSAVFVDYHINRDRKRSNRLSAIVAIIVITHLAILLADVKFGFYFVITPDNLFQHGRLFFIRLFFAYCPALAILIDIFISRKNVQKDQITLILFFILMASLGPVIDLIYGDSKFVWSCFASALLFLYFFIIRSESLIDSLTGINNRRSCDEYLRHISNETKRKDYGFVMIDLDHFKEINDKFGHLQGDIALHEAAQLINRCVRKSDFVARYGGDEFFLILFGTGAKTVVDRIIRTFDEYNKGSHHPFAIEASIGYDIYAADNPKSPQEFIAHVDELMYNQKRERNTARLQDKDERSEGGI